LFYSARTFEVTRRYLGTPDYRHQTRTGLYLKCQKRTVLMSLFVNLNFWLYMVLQVSVVWFRKISLGRLMSITGGRCGRKGGRSKTGHVRTYNVRETTLAVEKYYV
jgi:hypothetical protein